MKELTLLLLIMSIGTISGSLILNQGIVQNSIAILEKVVQQIRRPKPKLNMVYKSMSTKIILYNGEMVFQKMASGLMVIVIGDMIVTRQGLQPISGHALSA